LRSIHAHIGPDYDRVRLGVGHPGHKDAVPGYVLRDFPKADEDWLDDILRGIGDGIPALVAGDGPRFLNAIALRVAPPRSLTSAPKPKPDPETPQEPSLADNRSPLQKLMDRFK
jgi:PTH1 family peptidyl-tRNA hydrolase